MPARMPGGTVTARCIGVRWRAIISDEAGRSSIAVTKRVVEGLVIGTSTHSGLCRAGALDQLHHASAENDTSWSVRGAERTPAGE